MVKDDGE
jgi:dynein heavy chain, axonemal